MTTPVAKQGAEHRAAGRTSGAFFTRVRSAVARCRRDVAGATSIEYGLITGLIFLAIVSGVRAYSTNLGVVYDVIATALAPK